MDVVIWLIGLLLIGCGFLVKYAPDVIAGYNTMPEDKKKNVDVEGLSTFLRNGLVLIGTLIIAGFYLFRWLSLDAINENIMLIVVLGGVLFLVIYARRYDHNKK